MRKKQKAILEIGIIFAVAIGLFASSNIAKNLMTENPFAIKVTNAAEDTYYRNEYNCDCDYEPPQGCNGQPVEQFCDATSGVECTKDNECTFVFWEACQGMAQHSCDSPD